MTLRHSSSLGPSVRLATPGMRQSHHEAKPGSSPTHEGVEQQEAPDLGPMLDTRSGEENATTLPDESRVPKLGLLMGRPRISSRAQHRNPMVPNVLFRSTTKKGIVLRVI
jgi:hypothetical protein